MTGAIAYAVHDGYNIGIHTVTLKKNGKKAKTLKPGRSRLYFFALPTYCSYILFREEDITATCSASITKHHAHVNSEMFDPLFCKFTRI